MKFSTPFEVTSIVSVDGGLRIAVQELGCAFLQHHDAARIPKDVRHILVNILLMDRCIALKGHDYQRPIVVLPAGIS